MTLLLTRSVIERLLDVDEALRVLRDGFRAAPAAEGPQFEPAAFPPSPLRVRTDLPGPGTATCLMPGLLPGVPAYTVKVNAKFPAASPALRGVVCLHDLATGELLALADSATVTAWRTGLSAALGTDLLANPSACTLGFVGAGAQARVVAAGLRRLRTWERVVAADLDPARAASLGADLADGPRAVARESDVVVLATWSRRPLLDAPALRPGHHLTSLGADEPGKIELSGDLLRSCRVVVDDRTLTAASGALGNAGLPAAAAAATLGEILRGERPGREGPGQCTVYAPIGLPWQDLALTWLLYQRAAGDGQTSTIDMLS
ncbi:MAG: ornithine cyclodeaminase family protein [Streptosporangiaceae bacterium]